MKTPANLMRKNCPEFIKQLKVFRINFNEIEIEHITFGVNEFGKKFEGVEVNPILSEEEVLTRVQLSKRYKELK